MTQHDEQVLLSDVQVQAIREELQSQLMWRTSRLDELRALVEGGGGTEDGSKTNVLTDLTETELAIAEIRETLERLEDGSYGRCEDCGTAIPFERLKIRPLTRHCVPCRQRHEHNR
jgi:DnaK suppressor protein